VKSSKELRLLIAMSLLLFSYGMNGCGTLSPSNAPVDCDAVKNQEQAGYTDAKIAADLGTTADKVAACHGPKTAVGPQD
jgi:hypothetical protein